MFKNKKLGIFIIAVFIVSFGILFFALPIFADVGGLTNPLGTKSIPELVGRIIKAVLGIVGSIALLMFMYGGITWMTSAGSPEKVKKGRDTLIWATIGLATIFFAYAGVSFVIKSIGPGESGPGEVSGPGAGEEGAMSCECTMQLEERQWVQQFFDPAEYPFSGAYYGPGDCVWSSITVSDCEGAVGEGFIPSHECSGKDESQRYYCEKEDWVPEPETIRVSGSDDDDIEKRCLELCDDNAADENWKCGGVSIKLDTCSMR